ncbi:hypothetical protein GUJ93_ZPchr0004g40335 [Zizania palustris]|uniref:Uncharacterized protein n=1 Tax=Zizania palustris TaxID=103762 RepID=A0A8J5SAH4_ZIZPA|nr:hypothetical protein GUJ93_ZPchr0004g40335 [Zizania palustris]
MASNYVDTAGEEGRFHGYHSSGTTPTGAAASPKMRRSWSSAASVPSAGGSHGAAPKCVCAPATHAGSFKCRLHRSSPHGGHGHGHGNPSSSSPAAATPPPAAAQPSSSRTVAAQ